MARAVGRDTTLATRRTLALSGLVFVGLVLVAVVEPPRRLTGLERSRGPRPFRTSARGIRRIEVEADGRRLAADRVHDGWRVEGAPASPVLRDALDALADELAGLRAVDAFRPSSLAALGLDPPEGAIVVTTPRGVERLAIGGLNAAGSTVYAKRDGHDRVLQLGVYLVEVVQRVFGARDVQGRAARAYWPEIG
jgi:hypothetical protein